MQIDASDVINRLTLNLAEEVQKRVIAEAQAAALEKQIEELKEDNGS